MDKKSVRSELVMFLPDNMVTFIDKISDLKWDMITEIRITLGNPLIISTLNSRCYAINKDKVTNNAYTYTVSTQDIQIITELITRSSIYSYERYINSGFITLPGGNRVGIVGTCNCNENKIVSVQHICAFNIRVAHQIYGASDLIIDDICFKDKIFSTLIISPPGCGKTTVLRDIARALSVRHTSRIIVCAIIDERFEIACAYNGISSLDVGRNNFVVSGCTKSTAISSVIRSMSPDVIITDELSGDDDFKAVSYAKRAGCTIIASVHGKDELCNELSDYDYKNIFEKIVILSKRKGPGTVEKIIEGERYDSN